MNECVNEYDFNLMCERMILIGKRKERVRERERGREREREKKSEFNN